MSEHLNSIFEWIDANANKYVEDLKQTVSIPSISASPEHRQHLNDIMKLFAKRIENMGAKVELHNLGMQRLFDGTTIPLPPVILGDLGYHIEKPTVLVYGHLDVQPAERSDGWNTDPFQMEEIDGNLYGRGTTDDKGPVLGWLNAIQACLDIVHDVPVNIKFCIEGMEESDSEGLDRLLSSQVDTFLKNVDFVVISDNNWLNRDRPCITYGLRGTCHFFLQVTGAKQDLHSGIFGGSVPEAMIDCVHLLSTLVDRNGCIQVPGVYDKVLPVTEAETQFYEKIDFNVQQFMEEVGCERLWYSDKVNVLQHLWRHPSLSIHGIEGAFSGVGCKTVIPGQVNGKFTIRLVPQQEPKEIENLVIQYLEERHRESGSPNKVVITATDGSRPFLFDPIGCISYQAARRATEMVWQVEPDLIREGGSVPVALTFQELTGKSVLLLPMGQSDDGAHSQNEKVSRRNYIQCTKLMAAYFFKLAELWQQKKSNDSLVNV